MAVDPRATYRPDPAGPDGVAQPGRRRSATRSPRCSGSTASPTSGPPRGMAVAGAGRRRPRPSRAACPAVPARAVRRDAPAGADRHRAGRPTGAGHRRRADQRPRRHRAAADPRPHRRAHRRRAPCAADHPRPRRRRRPGRPHRGDVAKDARGARSSGTDPRTPTAQLHEVPDRRGAEPAGHVVVVPQSRAGVAGPTGSQLPARGRPSRMHHRRPRPSCSPRTSSRTLPFPVPATRASGRSTTSASASAGARRSRWSGSPARASRRRPGWCCA